MDMAMGAMGLGIILTLRDQASNGIDKIREKMTGLQGVSEQMTKRFDAGVKQMMGGLGAMMMGGKMLSAVNNTVGVSVTVAASFEQAMARVQAVSGATRAEFEKLQAQAKQLGRDTQFSASQVASAQELLARAGFKVEEGNNQIIAAMPGLLNMAAAEGMGLAEAADIAAGTLRGFGMEANEMDRVANALAKGSASANVSIATIGEALRNVAPDANALGLSLEETIAIIGKMGDSAIKGGRAGTALSSIMSKISAPTSKAQKALASLGVTTTTSSGDLLEVPEILDNISKAMKEKGLGTAQKQEILKDLFGLTSKTEAQVILNAIDDGGLKELTEKIRNAGDAAGDMSKVMNDTLQGSILRLESASEGLRIAIGDIFKDAYRWAIDKLADLKGWLTGLIESFPLLSKLIIGGVGALVTFAGVVLILSGAVMAVYGGFKMWVFAKPLIMAALTAIKTQAVAAIAALKAASAPLLLLIGLGAALYAAWKSNFGGIRDMLTAITEGFSMAVSADEKGVTRVSRETADRLKKAGIWDFAVTMGKVFYRLREMWAGFKEGFMETVEKIREGLRIMSDKLSEFLRPGRKFLEWLGILDPLSKSSSDTWREWGNTLGKWVPLIIAAIAALKGASVVAGILQGIAGAIGLVNAAIAANPIGMIFLLTVGAITLMSMYWDDFGKVVKNVLISIGDIVWGVIDTIVGFFKFGIALITGDWKGLADAIEHIFKGLVGVVKGILDTIWGLISPIIDGVSWVLEALGFISPETHEVIKNALSNEPSADITEYEHLKKAYEAKGFVFDDKGNVKKLPADMYMLDIMQQEGAKEEAARRLKEAKAAMPAMPVLAQQSQTQAVAAGQATAQAVAGAPGKPLQVKNNVNMVVQPTTTDVVLDSEKLGEIMTRYEAHQLAREGYAVTQ